MLLLPGPQLAAYSASPLASPLAFIALANAPSIDTTAAAASQAGSLIDRVIQQIVNDWAGGTGPVSSLDLEQAAADAVLQQLDPYSSILRQGELFQDLRV